ncbi:ribonuclease E inhibitor RraB [Shewanella eurypsychrophilus]|uniref:Ribonuclease E inhibitor RraB n=1 Tax=Shewanella eurypsychrophilus TaxID=2593656 RepID=A0ABX6V460_9GAMM|nr:MULTISPECIES: ribonuclease E inhibitor RraB [Shewanella]QFU22068.1 ribonuclease E inhibitor RraB [Shewanella sp. YLB-09]QPG57357.1 ribonuclease E inhibitor RraB [Shewanella eurypsychrophilus]
MQFPDDDNGKMLAAMAEAGIDLTKQLDVDFFLVFDDQRDAESATEELAKLELEGEMELQLNDEVGKWELIVCVPMVPEYQAIVDQELQLNTFAEEFGGATDGWGVMQHQEGDDDFADEDDGHECGADCKH